MQDKKDYPELIAGEWIHARTIEGHQVFGFIKEWDALDKTVLIRVHHKCCASVREEAWARARECEVAEESKLTDTEGYIRNMIDWALTDRDEAAFMHYTESLRKLNDPQNSPRIDVTVYLG